ncbi:hypothetical protein [Actinoplanes cyaneus]|uniref:hypothetical protein n=1 Tax=Actinoplanes cyaneus TaxID=52696 RepID=UPI001943DA1A|nr:hypothetical protein [Actinoplanes cyaneus]MCW2143518.1 hypothetical protein [Actinoplanes cyaneus]
MERVVRDRYPRSAAGWESALEELRTQLTDGTIEFWHADRIRQALAGAIAQAQLLAVSAPAAPRPVVDERLEESAAVLLRLAVRADDPRTAR